VLEQFIFGMYFSLECDMAGKCLVQKGSDMQYARLELDRRLSFSWDRLVNGRSVYPSPTARLGKPEPTIEHPPPACPRM
jgi:hypothetical protein